MSVESVNYISDLDPAKPLGSDKISLGDDHIRNIKKSLRQTFTNINAEVAASDEELNYLVGLSEPVTDLIDAGSQGLADLEARVTVIEGALTQEGMDLADQVSANTAEIQALKDAIAEMGGGTGGMIKVVQQPDTAGDFRVTGTDQTYRVTVPVGNDRSATLTVPDGQVFCFEYLFGFGGGTLRVDVDQIYIDGVRMYASNQGYFDYDSNGGGIWPGNDKSSIIRVEQSLEVRGMSAFTSDGTLHIAGIFAEA